jgi:hypothetical protein
MGTHVPLDPTGFDKTCHLGGTIEAPDVKDIALPNAYAAQFANSNANRLMDR